MPIIPKATDDTASNNKAPYRASLVNRSHRILKMGYDRLDSGSFVASEEEVITGRLTQAMQESLEDMRAPLWAKNFSAHEEKRVNDGERDGKRRLRIDIEVIEHLRGPRPRFRFEAKRLRDTASRREYLGHDGLGCFLDGRYAADNPDAGMLGYVQEGKVGEHVAAIAESLRKAPAQFNVTPAGGWKEHHLVKDLKTYLSAHERINACGQIVVIHTLLEFQ